MMPSSSRWKLLICCGINFEPLGLTSLHIKVKVYHRSFQPDTVRVWKLIFRAVNGLHFATLSWNLYSTKVGCWVPLGPLCCPFLGGGKQPFCGGDLPSSVTVWWLPNTVPSPPAHSSTLPLSPPCLQVQGGPGDEAPPAPGAWIGLLYPVTLSNAPVWSLLLAEPASGGLLCYALDLCQAIQLVAFRGCLLSSPSSTWLLWVWAVIKYRAVFILCVPLWVSCW